MWAKVVKDWNKTKVIKDDTGVYALPLRDSEEYNEVKTMYDKIKGKQKEKEIKVDKELQKKVDVKKPIAEVKKVDEMNPSKDVYYLYHYDNKFIPGLSATLFKGKEQKEYLKKVFDKLYPGNKGLTSNGYTLLTADLGPGKVGIEIFKQEDGKVHAKLNYDLKENKTDKELFKTISNEVYGNRIEEERKKLMDEEERQLQERNKKMADELKAKEPVKEPVKKNRLTSPNIFTLMHNEGKIKGLYLDLFKKPADKKKYLKSVLDVIFPDNEGLTKEAYKLLTTDHGNKRFGIELEKQGNGLITATIDETLRHTDSSSFDAISKRLYGDIIKEAEK